MAQPRLPVPQLMKRRSSDSYGYSNPHSQPCKNCHSPCIIYTAQPSAYFYRYVHFPQVRSSGQSGASAGFLLAGFPPEIVARALSQTIFVVIFPFT